MSYFSGWFAESTSEKGLASILMSSNLEKVEQSILRSRKVLGNTSPPLNSPHVVVCGTDSNAVGTVTNCLVTAEVVSRFKSSGVTYEVKRLELIRSEAPCETIEFGHYSRRCRSAVATDEDDGGVWTSLRSEKKLQEFQASSETNTSEPSQNIESAVARLRSPKCPSLSVSVLSSVEAGVFDDSAGVNDATADRTLRRLERENPDLIVVVVSLRDSGPDPERDPWLLAVRNNPDFGNRVVWVLDVDVGPETASVPQWFWESNFRSRRFFTVRTTSFSSDFENGFKTEADWFATQPFGGQSPFQDTGFRRLGRVLSGMLLKSSHFALSQAQTQLSLLQHKLLDSLQASEYQLQKCGGTPEFLLLAFSKQLTSNFGGGQDGSPGVSARTRFRNIFTDFSESCRCLSPFSVSRISNEKFEKITINNQGFRETLTEKEYIETFFNHPDVVTFAHLEPPMRKCLESVTKVVEGLIESTLSRKPFCVLQNFSSSVRHVLKVQMLLRTKRCWQILTDSLKAEQYCIWSSVTDKQKVEHSISLRKPPRQVLHEYFNRIVSVFIHTVPKTVMYHLVRAMESSVLYDLLEDPRLKSQSVSEYTHHLQRQVAGLEHRLTEIQDLERSIDAAKLIS